MGRSKKVMQHLQIENVVDLVTLQQIQDTFAQAMGFASVIVNKSGRPITRLSSFLPICRMTRSTKAGRALCWECDANHGVEAYKLGRSRSYRCHMGLLDVAAPIVIEGEHVGSILCGQVIPSSSSKEHVEHIVENGSNLGLPLNDVKQAAQKIPTVSPGQLDAAIEMLRLAANHIIEMGMASLTQARLLAETQEKAALQSALQSTQLQFLQLQINPHFLFNSLTLISYTAIKENAPQTEEIAHCLSEMLRYLLRNIASTVTLGEELAIIEQYLTIQQLRFGERLKVQIELNPSLQQLPIPCMLLQPLVENVIVHAVESLTRPVSLKIKVSSRFSGVLIEILDDGVGMDAKIAASINNRTFTAINSHKTSLGLGNVMQRLEGEYGSEAYIHVESEIGKGTQIFLFLPIRDNT